MPRPTASKAVTPPADADAWVARFRKKVKAATPTGWTVCKDRNSRMRLQLRVDGVSEGVALPYEWNDDDSDDALQRIKAIAKIHSAGGVSLKEAAKQADTTIVTTVAEFDWDEAVDKFRVHKANVNDKSWHNGYEPLFDKTLKALSKRNAPTNGPDLVDMVLKGWTPGTRQRQLMRQRINAFLRFCVNRLHYKNCWLPPDASTVQGEAYKKSRDGYPLSDQQIIRLLAWLEEHKTTVRDKRWRFAFQLCAVFGLRPEDLQHLTTKRGGKELWSNYRKSKGGNSGDKTEPRRLYPLFVHDIDGNVQDWNLIGRFHIGEELPPLNSAGNAGDAMRTYLRRQPIWDQLRAEAEAEGEVLVPYSFRHRWAYVAHTRQLPTGGYRAPKQIADAMGHDLATHEKHYARFATKNLADVFDSYDSPNATAVKAAAKK